MKKSQNSDSEPLTFLHKPKKTEPVLNGDSNCTNEPVRRPSIADMKKSIWFEKKELIPKDTGVIATTDSYNIEPGAPHRTVSQSMNSSTSSLLSSVSSRTITNSLSVSQFSNLFKSDTLSKGEGSIDSVVVKMKETAVPLPPAVLVAIPPKAPTTKSNQRSLSLHSCQSCEIEQFETVLSITNTPPSKMSVLNEIFSPQMAEIQKYDPPTNQSTNKPINLLTSYYKRTTGLSV